MNRVLLVLGFCTLVIVSGFGSEEDNRFALVIGNAAYEGEAALANSVNDASDVASALQEIGWKVTKVLNADRRTMNRTLAEFRDAMSATKNPTALLYYAGHGTQINGQNYLMPVKEVFESPDDVVNDALSLQTITSAFEEAKVSINIVILDACRDNPFVKKNTRSLGGTRGLTVVPKAANIEGSAVMFATAPGETAADGNGRNGVFTQALLKYIKTDIKLQDLATKVTGEVKKLTGGKQVPYNSLSLSDDYYLVPASLRTTATEVAPVGVAPASIAMFKMVVEGPVAGMQVSVDGKPVGLTPFQASYDMSRSHVLTLSHPDYAPYQENVVPAGKDLVMVRAEVAHSVSFQLKDLTAKKSSLNLKLGQAKAGGQGWSTVSLLGWVGTAAGAGLAGWSYYQGEQIYADQYKTAKTAEEFAKARSALEGPSTLWKVGLYGAGGSLLVAILTGFLVPNTQPIEKQISDVDQQISLLGGS